MRFPEEGFVKGLGADKERMASNQMVLKIRDLCQGFSLKSSSQIIIRLYTIGSD